MPAPAAKFAVPEIATAPKLPTLVFTKSTSKTFSDVAEISFDDE